ncbi:MAG: DUF4340 domain-containing protein [Terriglobia bacterium]
MKWRNLWIWAVVLAGLGGFVYFYEFRGEAKREQARQKAEKVFDVQEEAITSITLQRGSEKLLIDRQNGLWMIDSPVSTPADQSAVNDIVRTVSSATTTHSLASAQNLAEYGLQPPKIHAEFKTRPGASLSMDLGEKDFSENNVYAKVSSRIEVVLLPTYLFSSMDKSLMQLRDRKVMELNPEKVTQVEFVSKGDHLKAQKLGTEWKLTQPVSTQGDPAGIAAYLNDVSNSEASEFVDKPEPNLKSSELDPPAETLIITEGEGSQAKPWKLFLGAKKDDQVYAKRDGSSFLFKVTSIVADKLRPAVFRLRDKRIIPVNAADLQHVLIQLEAGVYEFDREGLKGSKWKVVLPKNLAGKEAREWKFWLPLEEMKADEILDSPASLTKTGLFFKPAERVTLVDRTNHQTEVRFSKAEKDSVWIRSSGSHSVFRLPSKKVGDWIGGLKEIVE